MTNPTRKRRNVQFYLEPDAFQNLVKEARTQHRPISNLASVIILDWLAARPTRTTRNQAQTNSAR